MTNDDNRHGDPTRLRKGFDDTGKVNDELIKPKLHDADQHTG